MDLGAIASGVASTGLDVWKLGRASDEASFNRDWQERMSNTAWQRGTADMRAAGINPLLAFSQGGASSPAGSVGVVGDVGNPMTTAYETQSLMSAAEKMKWDARTSQMESEKSRAEAGIADMTNKIMGTNFSYLVDKQRAEANSASYLSEIDKHRIAEAKSIGDMWNQIGKEGKIGQFFLPFIKSLISR